MSNDPNTDPIGHAAKFMWIFALIPAIFGLLPLFLTQVPMQGPVWVRYSGLIFAALVALIGVGVHRRSVLVAWLGIALFSIGAIAVLYMALRPNTKGRAVVVLTALMIWPIIKLKGAIDAINAEKTPREQSP